MTGTLEHLDPNTLVLADNVRDDAALDAPFLASIREHGVLQPITATRGEGGVAVRDGQRRTLAARDAGLPTIPVYVLHDADDGTAARIAHQIVTNDQRTALTDAQRVTGIHQMLLAGVSPTRVAQALSVPKATVTAAKTAATSTAAMAALADGQLDLLRAAAITEFESDPDAVAALIAAAKGPMFDHRLAQLRREREVDRALAEAETGFRGRGFTVLAERPGWRDPEAVAIDHLRTADGGRATEADVTDPARWAVWLTEDTVLVDTATGEPVDDRDVDWDTDGDPDAVPGEGQRHADTVQERFVWTPEYFCLDPTACGLTPADYVTATPTAGGGGTGGGGEDAEAVAEAQRRERRKVLTLNKLGLAAEDVRRAFVRDTLLARKTAIKGAVVFVATCLQQGPGLLTEHAAPMVAGQFLGGGTSGLADATAALTAGSDAKAQRQLLAMVLAALEARTPKDAWRSAGSTYGPRPGAAEYLRFLAGHGYPLSEVERIVTGEVTADAVFDDVAD